MSLCLSCMAWCREPICESCASGLVEACSSRLPGGIDVTAAFTHNGVARRLIHRLKYAGIAAAGDVFAAALAERLPEGSRALVPVPRSTLRRIRYGTDPAMTLAKLVSRRTGLTVAPVLQPALWWPSHAGSRRVTRRIPRFSIAGPVPRGSILVDDVLTTGATLTGAASVSGIRVAVTATRAGRDASG